MSVSNPHGLSESAKPSLWQQLQGDVRSVLERDPAARNWVEVLLTYPGVHALALHRVSHGLWKHKLRFPARLLSFLGRLLSNVDIHPGAQVGSRVFIDHGAGVVIGETAIIGDDVTLYHGVTLGGTSWNQGKRHPTLEDGVMVGAGAKVLGNITLGKGVRVGANSVVVEDVPESCTVVGIPGKIVRLRPAGELNPYGIDLDHHLIPDPVGRAISCLLERMDALEAQVQNNTPEERYSDCEIESDVCLNDCPGGQVVETARGR